MLSVVVPCSGPVPEVNETVTLTVAPRPEVELLPNWSWVFTTGCVAKTEPAVAPAGCVLKPSFVTLPATWDNAPKEVVPFTMPAMVALPGLAEVRRIVALFGTTEPSVAWT